MWRGGRPGLRISPTRPGSRPASAGRSSPARVAAQDAALVHAGQPPTSIFTGWYGEAAALDVLGSADRLPPVLSGHNAYWMWGPGRASDRTVLVVDGLGQLRPDFASCRLLTTYYAPYHVHNDWTNIQIGVCTGPVASWRTLWPHLRHYGWRAAATARARDRVRRRLRRARDH